MDGKGPIVGIDLGTTCSCVGIVQAGNVQIIHNDHGNRTTPSYVAFTDTDRLIGDSAKSQAVTNPENTIFDAKRLIGRKYNDPSVQEDKKRWPFNVVSDDRHKPSIEVTFKGKKERFRAEEISAMVLEKMKATAEEFLGRDVKCAVVTVPSNFTDSQRQATKNAARIAGLEPLRILNESTAAALAYGLDNKTEKGEKNVLVFDLGGGTFDVSLLTIDNGNFEVKATFGDTHLGGEDFDNRLVDFCCTEFKKQYKLDLTTDARALSCLRTRCERAKRELSFAIETTIVFDFLDNSINFSLSVSRARFEGMCEDYWDRCLEIVEEVVNNTSIRKSQIDEIVLVGGSSRIPKVQQIVTDFFNGKKPCKSINGDEAVAYGAAIEADRLYGTKYKDTQQMGTTSNSLLDVIPISLGIETVGGLFAKFIERNTTIPTRETKIVTTEVDNERMAIIQIFEGERASVADNNLLGTCILDGIPPAPRGVPKIEVTFDVDIDGILNVSATEKVTGKTIRATITDEKNRLSRAEIEHMIAKAEKYKEVDNTNRSRIIAKNSLESYCNSLRNTITKTQSKIRDSDRDTLMKKIDEVLTWLEVNSQELKEAYDAKHEEMEEAATLIMTKIS